MFQTNFPRPDDQIFDKHKGFEKTASAINFNVTKKVKISYEAISSSKLDTDDVQMSIQVSYYRVSYYFSKILTEVALEEKICKSFY